MKRSKRLIVVVFLGAALITIIGWRLWPYLQNQNRPEKKTEISAVATFYPAGYLVERIGGQMVTLKVLVPSGVEPHDYIPLPDDVTAIYRSDLFVVNGYGIDAWAEELDDDFSSPSHRTVVLADYLPTSALTNDTSSVTDPHFWLDPELFQSSAIAVRDALMTLDPVNAASYNKNAAALLDDLVNLDQSYLTGLDNCDRRMIIVSHEAFGYVGRRYNITVLPIAGLSPDNAPSANTLASLAATAKANGIKHVFFETLVSPELAQTLAAEIGATTLVLNPLEGLTPEEQAAGKDYFSIMQQNLTALRTAMQCD